LLCDQQVLDTVYDMASDAVQQRRSQAERRGESEEALLNAAAAVIAERGVERASLASIGEHAGASRGLPTHHFGSKEGLVARLAERVQDHVVATVRDELERAHRKPEELSQPDLLRTTLDTYLRLFENPTADERALIVMWGATFPSSASIDGMREADRRSYDGWADLIRHGQRDGSIRQDVDATAAAVALFGLMRGVAALLLTESDITDMRNVRQTCDAWIVAALAPDGH
jgi:AcrR family transcriptional regulator